MLQLYNFSSFGGHTGGGEENKTSWPQQGVEMGVSLCVLLPVISCTPHLDSANEPVRRTGPLLSTDHKLVSYTPTFEN